MEFAFPLTSPRESKIGLCGKDAFMFRQATRGCCLRSTLATWCSWCWCKDAGLMPPGVQGWSSLSYNLSLLLTSTKSGFVMISSPGHTSVKAWDLPRGGAGQFVSWLLPTFFKSMAWLRSIVTRCLPNSNPFASWRGWWWKLLEVRLTASGPTGVTLVELQHQL